jgi:hypothetical protein
LSSAAALPPRLGVRLGEEEGVEEEDEEAEEEDGEGDRLALLLRSTLRGTFKPKNSKSDRIAGSTRHFVTSATRKSVLEGR